MPWRFAFWASSAVQDGRLIKGAVEPCGDGAEAVQINLLVSQVRKRSGARTAIVCAGRDMSGWTEAVRRAPGGIGENSAAGGHGAVADPLDLNGPLYGQIGGWRDLVRAQAAIDSTLATGSHGLASWDNLIPSFHCARPTRRRMLVHRCGQQADSSRLPGPSVLSPRSIKPRPELKT
jgi:hypothetical protein